MTGFVLYNTLTRRVEPFAPADGHTVRMYTCGPTVYNPAHLGNFRTFLFEDLLRRVVRLRGWGVVQVMNLTDVDDKIIARANEQGVAIGEITGPMTDVFQRDRAFLRIEPAEFYPRATEHIPEMIAIVERLFERDLAYLAEDGSVYYAIAHFPGYGKLSRLDAREIRAGARVAADDYAKEDVRDFALWKAAKPEDERVGAAWDSPWGRGRPGWHLECSAMAMKYLGETLDIHCGGVDLIFPHHEDEIAQSEGATGREFARVWCHGEFLLTEGSKMAKRVGNVATVADLRARGIPAAALRHFVFSTHYRKQLNLSDEALEGSLAAVRRVGDFADRLACARSGTPELAQAAEALEQEASAALFDDLDAPGALAALFTFIRRANAELDRVERSPAAAAELPTYGAPVAGAGGGANREEAAGASLLARARSAFEMVNSVLEIVPDVIAGRLGGWGGGGAEAPHAEELAFAAEAERIEARLAERRAARERRDFTAADAIRAELEAEGVAIEDTPQGTRWKRLSGGW